MPATVGQNPLESYFLHLADRSAVIGGNSTLIDLSDDEVRSGDAADGIPQHNRTAIQNCLRTRSRCTDIVSITTSNIPGSRGTHRGDQDRWNQWQGDL